MSWQPITTAPKDGLPIRVRGFNFGEPARGRHYADAIWKDRGWVHAGDHLHALHFLTDWKPIIANSRETEGN